MMISRTKNIQRLIVTPNHFMFPYPESAINLVDFDVDRID